MNNDPYFNFQDRIQELEKQMSELREKNYFLDNQTSYLANTNEQTSLFINSRSVV